MALVNGGYFHYTDLKTSSKFFFSETAKKKKKNGYGPLKNSGERSRATVVLLFRHCTALNRSKK